MQKRIKFFEFLSLAIFIGFLLIIVLFLLFVPMENENLWLTCLGGLTLLGIIFFYIYYKLLLKIKDLKYEEIKFKVSKELSTDKLTEVLFCPIAYNGKEIILTDILSKTNFTYFAKINKEKNIVISVKNQNGEEVYNFKISNYEYFNENFEIKED